MKNLEFVQNAQFNIICRKKKKIQNFIIFKLDKKILVMRFAMNAKNNIIYANRLIKTTQKFKIVQRENKKNYFLNAQAVKLMILK